MPQPATSRRLKPRRTPRQARSTVTVEAVLEAAAQVFERHGYAAGTTNRIAERAGVSIGTLYQYFPNKDAILVALVEQHLAAGIAAMTPTLQALTEAPPPVPAGISALAEGLAALHRERPTLHRVLFEEAPRPAHVRAQLNDLERMAVALISGWLEARPEVRVDDVVMAARLVAHMLDAMAHRLVIHPDPDVDPQAALDETCVMLERYLTAGAR